MKKLLLLFIGAIVALYFLPIRQDSALYGIKSFIVEKAPIKMSSADPREELRYKKQELQAYEDVIAKIDAEEARLRADGPICPTTGEKAIVTVKEDPRPGLREKVQKLRTEIEDIESKI